jgi:hypothetical protein
VLGRGGYFGWLCCWWGRALPGLAPWLGLARFEGLMAAV